MSSPGLTSEIQFSKDVLFRELEGEAVLLNIKTGVYFGLDKTGTAIWRLLEKNPHPASVIKTMVEEYDVSAADCREDLLKFISSLKKNGLLQVHED
jgi:hypothetical protein